MKILMENWRKYLLLKESVNPKIMSMIDRAEERGLKVFVNDNGSWGTAILAKPKGDDPRPSGDFIASVGWSKPPPNYSGECSGAMEVTNSLASDGFGPLVYDVAIEITGGLTSDRSEVSDDAEAVWDKYAKRGDVERGQLDILDDYGEPQLTPDDESDDCEQIPAYQKYKSDWHQSSISKAFSKDGTPVMDELRKRGMLQE